MCSVKYFSLTEKGFSSLLSTIYMVISSFLFLVGLIIVLLNLFTSLELVDNRILEQKENQKVRSNFSRITKWNKIMKQSTEINDNLLEIQKLVVEEEIEKAKSKVDEIVTKTDETLTLVNDFDKSFITKEKLSEYHNLWSLITKTMKQITNSSSADDVVKKDTLKTLSVKWSKLLSLDRDTVSSFSILKFLFLFFLTLSLLFVLYKAKASIEKKYKKIVSQILIVLLLLMLVFSSAYVIANKVFNYEVLPSTKTVR